MPSRKGDDGGFKHQGSPLIMITIIIYPKSDQKPSTILWLMRVGAFRQAAYLLPELTKILELAGRRG